MNRLLLAVLLLAVVVPAQADDQRGIASYYAGKFHGRATASGERFDMHQLTAAHKTLPLGTRVRVTRTDTEASVVVRINDRGPFIKGRIIDLSLAAAKQLELIKKGTAEVIVTVLPAL